jgi:hypothetical protein
MDDIVNVIAGKLRIWLNDVNDTLRPVSHAIMGRVLVQHYEDVPLRATVFCIRAEIAIRPYRPSSKWTTTVLTSAGLTIQNWSGDVDHAWAWHTTLPDCLVRSHARITTDEIYQDATRALEPALAKILDPHLMKWRTDRDRRDRYDALSAFGDPAFDPNP